MRRKKHKSTRRAVRYYKINHGFRAPFKIILDGNFVHATEAAKYVFVHVLTPHILHTPAYISQPILFHTLLSRHRLTSLLLSLPNQPIIVYTDVEILMNS
jgi:hypothetical protein